ncbi:MAG: hypothetical protein ACO22M_00560 [Candidatus Nanopelagicaceae bacterium]
MSEHNVTLLKENEDGSAVYQFDFTREELDALTRLGIMTALMAGVADAKKYHPDYAEEKKKKKKTKAA